MQDSLAMFKEQLQKKGYNITRQRLRIARVFLDFKGHPTAEELLQAARIEDPSASQATVYRTLKLLCEAGFAREMHFGDGIARFESRNETEEHHDHLICEQCGKTIEFLSEEIERLQEGITSAHNFISTRHRLYLYGICPECRESKNRLRKL